MHSIKATLLTAAAELKQVSESTLLDAEILLCQVLKQSRSYLRTWPEARLTQEQCRQFRELLKQRRQGVPIAYLCGYKEFWSGKFKVTADVLIPRPETELLIELTLKLISEHPSAAIIDLGTGSGNIAISLAAECPDCVMTATDTSVAALAIARHNAFKHNVHDVEFCHSHWFKNIKPRLFDIVISNPPYIAEGDPHLTQGGLQHEPQCALIAADQGLADIHTISNSARHYLATGGHLLIEHGYDQQQQVQAIYEQFNYTGITTHFDLSGLARVTTAQWQGTSVLNT